MEHFYNNIQGWFDFENIYRKIVYNSPIDNISHFVEIGSWLGKSSSFMAVEILNSKKSVNYC